MASRPPQLRVWHFEHQLIWACAIQLHDQRASELQAHAIAHTLVGYGQLRRDGQRHALAVVAVCLHHIDGYQPIGLAGLYSDITPYASSHKTRAPVPPKLALLFSDSYAVAHWVIELGGRRKFGTLGADVVHGAGKNDAQLVVTELQSGFHGPPKSHKHIVCFGNFFAIQKHRGNRVQPVGHQINVLFGQHLLRHLEHGFVFPVALFNPLQVQLVAPVKRIVNLLQTP